MSQPSAIRWRAFGPDAFREARAADKPVLLRLSAVWCHWCHVMDDTSDRDPQAVRLLNERYVPIRVDIDQRPDVRDRYNFGGYPTSAFLTPDGQILTGGTYIPPEQFVDLLQRVDEVYRTRKDDLVRQIQEHRARHRTEPSPPKRVDADRAAQEVLAGVGEQVLLRADPEHGGFGEQPKFPHAAALEFALAQRRDAEGRVYETVITKTLDAMRGSALWDSQELGFFRYSVTRAWSEPHYEKMLDTNAGLLSSYAQGYGLLGRPEWLEAASGIHAYLVERLYDAKTGLFGGSQDADEAYYALPLAERRTRKAPYVDPRQYADWNAQMLEAYFDAYRATGDSAWLQVGLRGVQTLGERFQGPDGLVAHEARTGRESARGFLGDVAHAARAFLSAYELSGRSAFRDYARRSIEAAGRAFWDPKRLLYVDRAPEAADWGLLSDPQASIVENGVMARVLVRWAQLTGDEAAAARFQELVAAGAAQYERYGIFASHLALACLAWRRPLLQVTVVGEDAAVGPLVQETTRIAHANVVLRRAGPDATREVEQEFGIRGLRAPAAFGCARGACSRLFAPGDRFAAEVARLVA